MELNCPTCGEPAGIGSDYCAACGAILPADFAEAARLDTPDPDSPRQAAQIEESANQEVEDELTTAFRAQFERHEVVLPKKWIERLRRLASEVEIGHRYAAVFFVDIRGYTRIMRMITESEMDELHRWFYRMATARIEQHGGFVVQFIGDAVFAAFGAPWAFERDSESALHALLDIREDVRGKTDFAGHPIAIRAGANFGPLDVRWSEEQGQQRIQLFGSTVNLAARLEAQADTWEILISAEMAEQVRGAFVLEPRTEFEPKNYGRIVTPYAVIEKRESIEPRRRHDTKLIGRTRELSFLTMAAAEVERGGFRAVHVTGEAGIGKSRLLAEMMASAEVARFTRMSIDCEPHDRLVLFRGAIQLVRQMLRECAGAQNTFADAEGLAAALTGIVAAPIESAPSIGYLLGIEPHLTNLRTLPGNVLKEQIMSSLGSLFAAYAQATPLLLVVDDVQWCDRLTLNLIEGLARDTVPHILIVCAGRADGTADDYSLSGETEQRDATGLYSWSVENWDELPVEPLNNQERRDLVRQIAAVEDLPGPVLHQLLDETEGIPFYLIELASELAAEQGKPLSEFLAEHGSGATGGELPSRIIEILQARIDRLTAQRRAIVQCGAILGRRFSFRLLSLYENLHENLLEELYVLKGLRVVRDEPLPEDVEFVFTPSVLREVAYHMLSEQQKQQLHRTVAGLIEKRFADRQADFAYNLAYHWLRGKNAIRARPHLRQAVGQALRHGVPQDAYELVRQALLTTGAGNPTRDIKSSDSVSSSVELVDVQQMALLHESGGRACRFMGDFTRSDEHFETFLQIAKNLKNRKWHAGALHFLAMNAFERGEHSRADDLLRQSLAAAPTPEATTAARHLLALLKMRRGDHEAALGDLRELTRDLDGREAEALKLADCFNNIGLICWELERFEEASQAYASALEIWRLRHNIFGEVLTSNNLAIVFEKIGRLDDALATYETAYGQAERIGYFHGLAAIEANRANIHLLRQEFSAAMDAAARSLKFARVVGNRAAESGARINLGLAAGELGLLDQAFDHFDEARRLGERMKDPTRVHAANLASAWIYVRCGRTEEAKTLLDITSTEALPDHRLWRETLTATLDSLGAGRQSDLFANEALDAVRSTGSLENYLRRLDALGLLADNGIEPTRKEEVQRRRREAIGAASRG